MESFKQSWHSRSCFKAPFSMQFLWGHEFTSECFAIQNCVHCSVRKCAVMRGTTQRKSTETRILQNRNRKKARAMAEKEVPVKKTDARPGTFIVFSVSLRLLITKDFNIPHIPRNACFWMSCFSSSLGKLTIFSHCDRHWPSFEGFWRWGE